MAQLKDDCFAFGAELTPLGDALDALAHRIGPVVDIERVVLPAARGRILARDVVAEMDVPPHDNSAVDGYAVYFDDLDGAGSTRLLVGGRVAAGHPLGRPAERGEAIRIFTGAPMPAGADGTQAGGPDTVFMEEDCEVDGEHVVLPVGLKRGANRRDAGEDVRRGSVIVAAGTRLRPQEIGLAASVGRAELDVYARLRAAVFSTGDEVRDPVGTPQGGAPEGGAPEGGAPQGGAPEGCIFDANRYSVMALLDGLGVRVTDLGILADDADAITAALDAAARDHDLLVTSGGVSAGEEDHVRTAVERLGQIHFWRLAIKPGRPIALGQVSDVAVLGLPGNPVAAMVTFMVIGRPLVLLLSGARNVAPPRFPVEAGFDYRKKAGRREWARVRLESNGDGRPVAVKHLSSGAGILTSMVEADGLVELPEDVERLEKGETVDFLPFSEVTG